MGSSPRLLCRAAWAVTIVVVGLTGCSDDEGEATPGTDGASTASSAVPVLTPDAIPVLRASAIIPAGTEAGDALEAGLIEATTVTRDEFPIDGVVTIELVEGRRATATIPAGTILTLSAFSPR